MTAFGFEKSQPEQTHNNAQPSAIPGGSLPAVATLRSRVDHPLVELSINRISFDDLLPFLESFAAPLVPTMRSCFEDMEHRRPIAALDRESPTYFATDQFKIEHRQIFGISEGTLELVEHRLRVTDDRSADQFAAFSLIPDPSSPTGVNFQIEFDFSWIDYSTRWEMAEDMASLLNIPRVGKQFELVAIDQICKTENYLDAAISDRVRVRTLHSKEADQQFPARTADEARWLPLEVQITGIFADEQRAILQLLDPNSDKAYIDSGLFRSVTAFAEQQGVVRPDRLTKIASQIPGAAKVTFARFTELGDSAEFDTSDEDQGWNDDAAIDSDNDIDEDEDEDDSNLEFPESIAFVEPLEAQVVPHRFVFRSKLNILNEEPLGESKDFNDVQPSFGIEFKDHEGSTLLENAQERWRIVEAISRILEIPFDGQNLRLNFDKLEKLDPDAEWLIFPESVHGGRMVLTFDGPDVEKQ